MLTPEEVRVGLLVWWDRPEADCPCVIEEINKNTTFALRTIHDSVVTAHPRHHIMEELRTCTREEVTEYVSKLRRNFENEVSEARRILSEKQTNLDNMKTRYSIALDKMFFLGQKEELPAISV